MKTPILKIGACATFAAAALALSGCGSSDKASEEAQAENVEMPAEEAMTGADAAATPVADVPAAGASADATATAGTAPGASASAAAEKATTDAESKM